MAIRSGEIELTLAGTKVTLKPTVKVLRGLSSIYPSLYELSMRVAQFNLNAICDVIQIAADGEDGEDRVKLEESVFEYGVQKISPEITGFVQSLFNGGKIVDPKEAKAAKAVDPKKS